MSERKTACLSVTGRFQRARTPGCFSQRKTSKPPILAALLPPEMVAESPVQGTSLVALAPALRWLHVLIHCSQFRVQMPLFTLSTRLERRGGIHCRSCLYDAPRAAHVALENINLLRKLLSCHLGSCARSSGRVPVGVTGVHGSSCYSRGCIGVVRALADILGVVGGKNSFCLF